MRRLSPQELRCAAMSNIKKDSRTKRYYASPRLTLGAKSVQYHLHAKGERPGQGERDSMSIFARTPCWGKDTKKAVSLLQLTACFCCGAPEEIRTPGLQVRSLLLYPAELRARREGVLIEKRAACQCF